MLLRNTSVVRSFFLFTILIMAISILLFGIFWTADEILQYKNESEAIRARYLKEQKTRIHDQIHKIVDYVEYEKFMVEKWRRRQIRERVDEACSIAENIYNENRGILSDAQIRKLVKDALRPVRFNDGRGYFFAFNIDGIEELFPIYPEMEGDSMLDVQDSDGKYFILEMLEIAENQGEGFCEYTWTKPNSKGRDHLKMAYVKYFEPFRWIIGTGEYIDDMEQYLEQEMLNWISEYRFDDDGYIFVIARDGTILMNPSRPDLIGGNIRGEKEFVKAGIVNAILTVPAQNEGRFVQYNWENPITGRQTSKISYVKTLSDWDWIIGTGVHADEFEKVIEEKRDELFHRIRIAISQIMLLAGFFILVLHIMSRKYSEFLTRQLDVFKSFFQKAVTESTKIDKEKLMFSEFRDMADSANRMLTVRLEAEKALRKSERKYRHLIENAPIGIITVSTDGTIVEVNKRAVTLLGSPSVEKTRQINMLTFPPLIEMGIAADMRECLEKGASVTETRQYSTKWGKQIYVRYYFIPLVSSQGRIYGSQAIFEDISEQKHLEEQVQIRQKMDSIGTLAGGIAHDFNNLLAAIMGNLDLLLMDTRSLSGEQREHLEQAVQTCRRAAGLIQEIQTLSRSTTTEKKAIDVHGVANDVCSILTKTTDRLIEKRNDIEPGRFFITANAGQIHQVLLNLGTNAVQAIEERGVRAGDSIRISAEEYTADGNDPNGIAKGEYVHLSFQDNGSGMTEDVRQKAFDPLFTTKNLSAQKGQGLGLAMVYNIITRTHNGYVELSSEPGNGTVVHIYLPRAREVVEEQKNEPRRISGGTETVLLVEDEDMVRNFVKRVLTRYGYTVITAIDGAEGLEKFTVHHKDIDLVLLDLTMPRMSGKMLLEEMVKIDGDVRVIISSGQSEEEIQEYSQARDYITKPYEVHDLMHSLRTVLDG